MKRGYIRNHLIALTDEMKVRIHFTALIDEKRVRIHLTACLIDEEGKDSFHCFD